MGLSHIHYRTGGIICTLLKILLFIKSKRPSILRSKLVSVVETRIELISENDVEKLYEYQKFDLAAERYVLDEDNAETVEIDGKEYKADKGRIIVPKELSESEAKVKELEKELEKKDLENKIALAEVYDMIIKKVVVLVSKFTWLIIKIFY